MGEKRHLGTLHHIDRLYYGALIGLADFARRRAFWVLAVAVLLTAASLVYTVTHFAISTDMSKMLSQDLPFERAQQRFNKAFPGLDRTLLIVVHSDSQSLARRDAMRLAHWLRRHGRGITQVNEPDGGRFFTREGLLYLSRKDLWRLSDRLSQAQPFMATLAAHPTLPRFVNLLDKALAHAKAPGGALPGLVRVLDGMRATVAGQGQGRYVMMPWGRLMGMKAPGGGTADDSFIVVKPHYDYKGGAPVRTALASVQAGVRALKLDSAHGVTVRITGSAALDNDQVQTVSQSAGVATGLSLTLVLVMLVLGLRRARYVAIILLTLFMGLTWTAAFALMATGPMNLISVAFAVLFVGLGVDFGIQFCIRYQEEGAAADNAEAIRATARGVGGALSLAAVAAAISFYSFVPTSYAGIVDLGIISGTGMFFALIANLTVTPALLTLFVNGNAQGRPRGHLRSLLAHIPAASHPRAIIAGALVVAIGFLPLIRASRFDFDPMHLQDRHSEAVSTFESLLKNSSVSPYPIDILEPDLAHARRLAARLAHLKTVGRVLTAESYIPAHQNGKLAVISQMALVVPPFSINPQAAHAPQASAIRASLRHLRHDLKAFAAAAVPAREAAAARALYGALGSYLARFGHDSHALKILQRRVIGTLPWQLAELQTALNAQPVSLKTLPPSLRQQFISADGRARVEVFSSLDLNHNRNIVRFARDVTRLAPDAVGPPILLVQGGRAVVDAFREATFLSFVLITAVLLLALRSVADALTILVPLLLAAMAAVAVMEVFGISFNLANIIVLPLLIGLSVAFSIYLVVRWRRGVGTALLLDTSTSEAVVFSALTTMSSFGSLAVSSNPGMAVLGETLFIAMGAALATILLVLPAILSLRQARHEPHA
ncbi:MMPL family transporter [Acidiferrobacter sp.]|uniref:MMPL family transporter n=1 Tax=Acidiferrobacter sp. TaxID=1872107 RepID=UPI00260391BA|nr:MMPL family transporter [Acidiferrobacter sp.]